MTDPVQNITARPEAEAIIQAARVGVAPHGVDGGQRYVVTDLDGRTRVLDFSTDEFRYLDGELPCHRRGAFAFTQAAGFIDYIKNHAKPDRTELWADRAKGSIVAVLDGHDRSEGHGAVYAGWGLHRAELTLAHTPEWVEWRQFSAGSHKQEAFADFLEDHLLEVVEPAAADLLEVATSLSITSGTKFSQAVRLASGEVSFNYEEEHQATAGRKKQLTIPKSITLALSPFEGVDPYKATARFRYTLRNGDLTLRLILDRPHEILKAAFNDAIQAIEDGTELTIYHGTPAPPLITP